MAIFDFVTTVVRRAFSTPGNVWSRYACFGGRSACAFERQESIMGPYRKLWLTLIAVLALTFGLLGLLRRRSLSPGSADSVPGAQRQWRATVHAGRYFGWSDRLAIGGRHATGFNLGARRLSGAGLDGRLAASGIDGPRAARTSLCRAGWADSGKPARTAQKRIPQ